MAEAVRRGQRGARINTISPGIIITPLAKDELTGPRGEGYRRMTESSAVGRAGTPDEVGAVGALLMGQDGGFIIGSDFLMDGGVTAAYWYGEIPEVRMSHASPWSPTRVWSRRCRSRGLPGRSSSPDRRRVQARGGPVFVNAGVTEVARGPRGLDRR